MELVKNIKSSYSHLPYTIKHIKVLYKLQMQYLGFIAFPFHDMDKILMYIFLPFLGTKKISQLHRKFSSHHLKEGHKASYSNIAEAVLDWESARYTKPDKPLNAYQTCLKYYPQWKHEVEAVLIAYNIPK